MGNIRDFLYLPVGHLLYMLGSQHPDVETKEKLPRPAEACFEDSVTFSSLEKGVVLAPLLSFFLWVVRGHGASTTSPLLLFQSDFLLTLRFM